MTNYKEINQTEIRKIPKEWRVVQLEEVIKDIKNGFASGKRDDDGIVQIRMNNVTTDGHLIFYSFLKVPVPENINEFLVKENDLLFNNTNSIDLVGKSTIFKNVSFPCTFSNHFTRIRFRDDVLPEWVLFHFIRLWKKGFFRSVAIRHVGQAAVQTKYLTNLKLPVPPLPEQKKIAEILSTVDQAIEKVDQAIGKTQKLKKGLLQELLTKGIGHREFKETEIGRIPGEWAVSNFRNIMTDSPKNGMYKNKEFFGRGFKLVRMTEVFKGDILEVRNMELMDATNDELDRFSLKEGDLLFARRSLKIEGSGKCVLVPKIVEPLLFESSIIRVRPNKRTAFPAFYLHYFNSVGRKQISRMTRTVAVSGITGSDLQKLLIPVPPLREQQEIARILGTADERLELLRNRKERLGRIKKGLMNDLLTGKVKVTSLILEGDFYEQA